MPPGVTRASPYRNRRDYFDSKKQVIQHLRDQGDVVLEVAEASKAEVEEAPKPQGQGPKTALNQRFRGSKAGKNDKKRPSEWSRSWSLTFT